MTKMSSLIFRRNVIGFMFISLAPLAITAYWPPVCSSSQERTLYVPCPRWNCADQEFGSKNCCMKENRDSFGRLQTIECMCDSAAQCSPDPPGASVDRATEETEEGTCSHRFELEFYKPCHADYCMRPTLVSEHVCCTREQTYFLPEACLCHPDSSCDLDKPEDSSSQDDGSDESSEESSDEGSDDGSDESSEDQSTEDEESLCGDILSLLSIDTTKDKCDYNGIVNLTRVDENGDKLVCYAVYTIAQVNNAVERVFLAPQSCGVLPTATSNVELSLQLGESTFKVEQPVLSTSAGPNGNWYIKVESPFTPVFSGISACESNVCSFDYGSMNGKVDFNKCKAVSWGPSDAATRTAEGLYEVGMSFFPGGCLDALDSSSGVLNALCFRTTDTTKEYCVNNPGSPVYCEATSGKEWVLLGMLASQDKCGTEVELKVIPFPV